MNSKTHTKSEGLQKTAIACFLLINTLLFAMLSPLCPLGMDGDPSTDSCVFKTVGFLMSRGKIPYVDIFDHKGPLIYLINWLGWELDPWQGVWWIELLTMFLIFTGAYRVARLFATRIYACIVVITFTAALYPFYGGGNYTEEYALPAIVWSLYWFLDYLKNQRITKIRLWFCGFCFAAVCLLRINMVVVWVVFCIAILIQKIREYQFKKLQQFLLWFVMGAGCLFIPIVLWLGMHGALQEGFQQYIVFNLAYADAGKGLTDQMYAVSFFLKFLLVLVAFLLSIWQVIRQHSEISVISLVFLCATFYVVVAPGRNFYHYGMILPPAMLYPFASVLEEQTSKRNRKLLTLFLALVLLAGSASKWKLIVNNVITKYELLGKTTFPVEEMKILNVINENTEADDTILVWGNWNFLYIMSQREPASRYSYQFPIGAVNPEIYTNTIHDLELNKPTLVIVEEQREPISYIQAYTEQHDYQLIYKNNSVKIYRK